MSPAFCVHRPLQRPYYAVQNISCNTIRQYGIFGNRGAVSHAPAGHPSHVLSDGFGLQAWAVHVSQCILLQGNSNSVVVTCATVISERGDVREGLCNRAQGAYLATSAKQNRRTNRSQPRYLRRIARGDSPCHCPWNLQRPPHR